ncbi:MAG TPA: outer membrane beta-barrel protein [Candidatus Angelobacter sp.]
MRKSLLIAALFLVLSISAVAQDSPKAEVFGGYSYLRVSVVGTGFNFNGGSGSIAFNPSHWWGFVADVGGYHNTSFGASTNLISYLFGPKFSYRSNGRLTPFAQALFGGAHENTSFIGISGSQNAFAAALGGGIDAKFGHHFAFRLIQAEYVLTKFNDGVNNRQNNARISTGLVYRWGGGTRAFPE